MDIRKGIVGIKSDPKSKRFLGTGFFVPGGIILTCAHVIDDYYQPGRQIDCLLEGETEYFKTNVIFFSPQAEYDLAILQPTTEIAHQPLPIGSSQSSKSHPFSIFGYPAIEYRGLNGAGTIMGWSTDDKGHTTLQLDSDQITHGFSGAPVWDEELRLVVGMLQKGIKNDEIGRPSFALPMELAKEIYPDLQLGAATAPGGLPAGSYLPFPRNALFTGRERDLESLAKNLFSEKPTATVISQAITGMGGVGKTQLAVEFAYRYGDQFKGVHWLDLRDPAALDEQIAACGEKMALQPWSEKTPEQVALTLRAWQTDGARLLILDNFESVKDASQVLARFQSPNLRLLITSRRSDWPSTLGLQPVPLDTFTPAESRKFLKKYLKNRSTNEELDQLAERLGHLPLALELAGRYFGGHPRLSVPQYLTRLEQTFEHASMRGFRADQPNPTRHDLDLWATFALSWEQVKSEPTQKIFLAAGYCAANTAIPPEIFEKTAELDETACDECIQALIGLGLLGEKITIHPLLAEFARHLDAGQVVLKKLTEALSDIAETCNAAADQTGNYTLYTPLLPHVRTVAERAEQSGIEKAGDLWNSLGYHVEILADYAGAKAAYERAIKIWEASLGTEHPQVATGVNNLGGVLQDLGDLAGAKAAYERALKIFEKQLGEDHPNVATLVNNLGNVLKDLGDLAGAKAAFERALNIDEATYGRDHPTVAIRVNNLGRVLQALGDLAGAKAAYERALNIDEAAYGPDHPNVAIDVNNLGSVLKALGDLAGAKAAFERALKIFEKQLGEDHPNVATLVNNLGVVLQDLGDLAGAKAAFERALNIDEATYGRDHPNVARDVNNLGGVLKDLGDLAGAKAAFERALKILKQFLPEEHPNIKIVEGNLRALDPHRPAGTSPKSEREI